MPAKTGTKRTTKAKGSTPASETQALSQGLAMDADDSSCKTEGVIQH